MGISFNSAAVTATNNYITNPKGLRRFRAALGDAQFSPVYIQCIGDSITEGVGVESSSAIVSNEQSDRYGWSGQLRQMFANRYSTLAGSFIYPAFSGTDTRVTLTGSPASDLTASVGTKHSRRVTTTAYVTFALPACTAFDILFYAGGSSDGTLIGGFEYNVDGGAFTTGLATGVNATPGHRVLSVTGLANTTHTIVVRGLHATNLQVIHGIRYHNGQGVVVARDGAAGWTIWDLLGTGVSARNNGAAGNANSLSRVLNAFGAFGNHLTIIGIGQNDGTNQGVAQSDGTNITLAGYQTYLQSAVDKVVANGGCCLLLGTALPPQGGITSPGPASYMDFHAAMKTIASNTDHCAFLDITDRWGTANNNTTSPDECKLTGSLALLSADTSVHPNKRGYGDIANYIFNNLIDDTLHI